MDKKKITIEITETLQRVVEIEASSDQEAPDLMSDKYRKEEIILDWGDFIEKEIKVLNESEL